MERKILSFAAMAILIVGLFITGATIGCDAGGRVAPQSRLTPRLRAKYEKLQAADPDLVKAFSSDNASQRNAALYRILDMKDPALAEPLLYLALRDPSHPVRRDAPHVIIDLLDSKTAKAGQLCGKEVVQALKATVLNGDPGDRDLGDPVSQGQAAHALSLLMTPEVARELLRAFTSDTGRTPVRDHVVVNLLIEHGDKRMVPDLVQMLGKTEIYLKYYQWLDDAQISASPADRALFALVKLTGQKMEKYGFYRACIGAQAVAVPTFTSQKNREESVRVFRNWWKLHKKDEAFGP